MSETNYIASPTFLDSLLDLNFRKAACGNNHTVLLEENGNLVAFGSNEYG
jgi:alpha-tubulin suppressor-like RCC1 family protein